MRDTTLQNREDDPQLKDRVHRLMEFLRELVKTRTRPVLDLRQHHDVIWLNDSRLVGVLEQGASSGEVLLKARRVVLDDPPELPEMLAGLVTGDIADSSQVPELKSDSAELKGQNPFDRSMFTRWLADWNAWATSDLERRPYAELYMSIHQSMQELVSRPESVEMVVASGLLSLSARSTDSAVHTHIVTQPVGIERDSITGDLLVRLEAESSPRFEDTQLLTGMQVFDSSGSRSMQDGLAQLPSPVDDDILVLLKQWAQRVLTTQVDVQQVAAGAQSNELTPSPALVLRKRGAFALLEYYDKMIAASERDGAQVPLGLAQLVDPIEAEERVAWLQRTGAAASSAVYQEPLFPLPANQEQSEIMDRLARDSGVVVEGPPGTGKTHTIANLVSSLLASGQRVLVTSEKAQALRVLRDKLPSEMQELCVSITDAGKGGSAELSRSVAQIASRKSSFSDSASQASIERLASHRDQSLSRRAQVKEQIRELRESETYTHGAVAPGFAGTAAQIVQRITAGGDAFGWLPGPVDGDDAPLSPAQFQRLLELSAMTTLQRTVRLTQEFPKLDAVLPPSIELQKLCVRATAKAEKVPPAASRLLEILDGQPDETLRDVRVRCERLQAHIGELKQLPSEFTAAADMVLSGQATHLWSKTEALPGLLRSATLADQAVGMSEVECEQTGKPALAAFAALATAMDNGQKWRGILRKSDEQKAVESLGALATVDGADANTPERVQTVAEHLRALDSVATAAHVLADLGLNFLPAGTRSQQVNALHQFAGNVQLLRNIDAESKGLTQLLTVLSPAAPRIRRVDDAAAVADSARAVAAAGDLARATSALHQIADEVARIMEQAPSPEGASLVSALGNGDWVGIGVALEAIADAKRIQDEEQELRDIDGLLRPQARALSDMIREYPTDPSWPARIDSMSEAWAWRRAKDWGIQQRQPGRDRELDGDLEVVEVQIAKLTAQLAAERAWLGCLKRMTAAQVQALQAYREQIANVGMGKGKHAERFRASARAAMRDAQGAVPAWVMPLQQVLASIPPEPGAFDVVIVDEASQADISSLFLLWLAPRVIVVGDDKQCAPSEITAGGLDGIFNRLDNYLPDLPVYLRDGLTPRSSMFSLLRTRFGQVVRLREHFRSMPEIINWSSNQFYRDAPLVPVRQFGADRLPPLRTTFVDGGVVTGRDANLSNRPEALAIVDAIEQCLANPEYDDKTFGVVVLQGHAQVDVISNELHKRLTAEDWALRRLRIGTPPDFQGDERHVVFLSMVIAPEQRVASLTKNEYQRRYNVAASRAQDQLWLFHSVAADSLRPTDLRHSLMTYMQSTSPAPAAPMPEGVTSEDRHTEFDSMFEQRVYLDIVARGYHANPQVEVNYRRIDLVVTGASGQLAVECDGDAFHSTPEQVLADIERERELKRCGWQFWRIRESEYYLDPVEAMSGLWKELDARGIVPGGIATVDSPSTTWAPTTLPDDESAVEDTAEVETVLPASSAEAMSAHSSSTPLQASLDEPGPSAGAVPSARLFSAEAVAVSNDPPELAPQRLAATTTKPGWEVMPRSAIPQRPAIEPGLGLRSRILTAAEESPVTTAGLADEWGISREVVRAALAGLVNGALLVKFESKRGPRYVLPDVHGLVNAPAPSVTRVERDKNAPNTHRATLTTQLPPAGSGSAKLVLKAAIWHGPLTVDRAMKLTRLAEPEVLTLIGELEQEAVLVKTYEGASVEWVRK